MAQRKHYLFGNGEKLKESHDPKPRGGPSAPVYTMDDAARIVRPKVKSVADQLRAIPPAACPNGEVIVGIVMHPKFISKSSFPGALLASVGIRPVGARSCDVVPRSATGTTEPIPTTEIHVAGKPSAFEQLGLDDRLWRETGKIADDWVKVEDWRFLPAASKVKPFPRNQKAVLFEAAIYAGPGIAGERVLESFQAFLALLRLQAEISERIDTPGLSFVAVSGAPDQAEQIAAFSFLRVIRQMPGLRLPMFGGEFVQPEPFPITFPTGPARNQDIKVLILDGGMPAAPDLDRYVTRKHSNGLADPAPHLEQHGLATTSASLFGNLEPGVTPPVPWANVVNYRVLDKNTGKDPRRDNYTVLKRIRKALSEVQYDFVNCSMGPDVPVDGDVDPWTSTFDEHFSSGNTLVTVAPGNNGGADQICGLHLIQPPGDAINVLSVGSHDGNPICWNKTGYSPVGTGRPPGLAKPDGLGFGGTEEKPYWVPSAFNVNLSLPVMGTSLASPDTLRAGIGVRAALGQEMTALAIKALLTHTTEKHGAMTQPQCGWGRFLTDVSELVECAKSAYTVIYKDVLTPKEWIRLPVPVPSEMVGEVSIKATICFACQVDPQNPANYARAAMQVYFRTNKLDVSEAHPQAPTTPFFGSTDGMCERELRLETKKWETTLQAESTLCGEELLNPVFDLHYIPRLDGQDVRGAPKVPVALVVTVTAPKVANAHRKVEERYGRYLTVLRPVIDLRLRV
jgi:hypothetical protein